MDVERSVVTARMGMGLKYRQESWEKNESRLWESSRWNQDLVRALQQVLGRWERMQGGNSSVEYRSSSRGFRGMVLPMVVQRIRGAADCGQK